MKNIILLLVLLTAFSIIVKAQSKAYKAIKVDLELGLNPIPAGDSRAIDFTLEPHYRFTDNFALGLRFQNAAVGDLSSESWANVKYYTGNALTADYYFYSDRTLLFAGGGLGVFTEENHHVQTDNFGFFPRLGLETGHFRASVEYNITGGVANYVSLNFGVFIGGGKKQAK